MKVPPVQGGSLNCCGVSARASEMPRHKPGGLKNRAIRPNSPSFVLGAVPLGTRKLAVSALIFVARGNSCRIGSPPIGRICPLRWVGDGIKFCPRAGRNLIQTRITRLNGFLLQQLRAVTWRVLRSGRAGPTSRGREMLRISAAASPPFIPRGNATENRGHGGLRCWNRATSHRSPRTCHRYR